MSRTIDTRLPKKALLIICEGNNTEPIFFNNFISEKDGFMFDISPRPKLSPKDLETSPNRGGRKRHKRQLLKGDDINDDIPISGAPPLSWVEAAGKQFDTFEEIWCVFDKDEHPRCQEAFEKADHIRQSGHNINIAFNSISIEYYFLLHFEYIYKKFAKSECKVTRKKKAHCLLPNAVCGYACSGDKCVNGYARLRGYWADSKSDDNLIYSILKDKLFVGLKNAELLRRESDSIEGDKPIYLRNPYTNTDYLIARLLGYSILTNNHPIITKADSTLLSIDKLEGRISIENVGKSSYMLKDVFVTAFDVNVTMNITPILLQPTKTVMIRLPGCAGDMYFIVDTSKKIIIVQ